MKHYLLLLLIIVLSGCGNKPEEIAYYFLEGPHLQRYETDHKIFFGYRSKVYIPELDTAITTYELIHFKHIDISFTKPASVLDSIKVFNAEWFSVIGNVSTFWENYNIEDTESLTIYMLEYKNNADSIFFRRVRRSIIGYI